MILELDRSWRWRLQAKVHGARRGVRSQVVYCVGRALADRSESLRAIVVGLFVVEASVDERSLAPFIHGHGSILP